MGWASSFKFHIILIIQIIVAHIYWLNHYSAPISSSFLTSSIYKTTEPFLQHLLRLTLVMLDSEIVGKCSIKFINYNCCDNCCDMSLTVLDCELKVVFASVSLRSSVLASYNRVNLFAIFFSKIVGRCNTSGEMFQIHIYIVNRYIPNWTKWINFVSQFIWSHFDGSRALTVNSISIYRYLFASVHLNYTECY